MVSRLDRGWVAVCRVDRGWVAVSRVDSGEHDVFTRWTGGY